MARSYDYEEARPKTLAYQIERFCEALRELGRLILRAWRDS